MVLTCTHKQSPNMNTAIERFALGGPSFALVSFDLERTIHWTSFIEIHTYKHALRKP